MDVLKFLKGHKGNMVNGALFAIFSFVNKGFSFFLLLILANYIAPVEYGYLSLFSTVLMLLGYFMAFSTEGYFSLSYLRDGKDASKKVYSNIFATSIVMFFLLQISLFFWGNSFSRLLSLPKDTLFFAVATAFLNVYVHTNLEYYRIQEKVKTYGIFSCGNALLNFITSILFVKTFDLGWEGRVYAITGCSAIYGLFALFFFFKKGFLKRFDPKVWKQMMLWGVPLIPHLASSFLKQGCDRYIINYFHSIGEVGIFSFALNLTTLITMIGFGFNQSNSVSIYKICSSKNIGTEQKKASLSRQRNIYILLYTVTSVAVVAGCMLLLPFVLPKYTSSIGYLPILGLYGMLACYYLVYTNYLFYYKKTKELMYITVATAILHLLLSLIFTRYSLYITCSIYCFCQLVKVLLVRRLALKMLQEHLE